MMILPRTKSMMFFAALGMVSVLALPVPDELVISSPSEASDVHAQVSPQVNGREITISKRMDHNQQNHPPIPLEPPVEPPAGPVLPFGLYWVPGRHYPPFQQLASTGDIYTVPAALHAPITYPAKTFKDWNQAHSHYIFDSNNIKYELVRKSQEPEPYTIHEKMEHITQSEFYVQHPSLHHLLLHDLFDPLVHSEETRENPDTSKLTLFNAYFILATGLRYSDDLCQSR
ncbi:hypothetical protein C8R42DRAFT_79863 [Lentinula raphanica]|nr:hypothetical protein C8R42DRAFT_79863 [Lentinula raphanica]